MIGDPFLNYFALGILFFVVIVLFYGISDRTIEPASSKRLAALVTNLSTAVSSV